MIKVNFKKTHELARLPEKSNYNDACYDCYATSKNDLGDGRIEYGLGFALEIMSIDINGKIIPYSDITHQFDVRPRSSIHKQGMVLSNSLGTIDRDYRGEWKAVFYKIIPSLPDYEVGDRICQIQYNNTIDIDFNIVDILSETERGSGGFGSTGLKYNEQSEISEKI